MVGTQHPLVVGQQSLRLGHRLLHPARLAHPGGHPGGQEQVLIESVEHHAEEEEQEMFPQTRKAFDKATTLEDLGMRLEARKGRAPCADHRRQGTP